MEIKIPLAKEFLCLISAYFCIFMQENAFICAVIYLFCFGLSAKKTGEGLHSLAVLKPDSNAVCATVNAIAFTVVSLSFALRMDWISGYLPFCICAMLTENRHVRHFEVFESLFFSFTVIFSGLTGVAVTAINNSPVSGLQACFAFLGFAGCVRGLTGYNIYRAENAIIVNG